MTTDDAHKKLQDSVMKFAGSLGDGVPDPSDLIKDLGSIMGDLQASGELPQDKAADLTAQVTALEEIGTAMKAALEAGNLEALEALSQQSMAFSGINMDDIKNRPAIFEAIDDADADAVNAALADWDVNARYGEFDITALYAAMSGFDVALPIIDLLLDAGADPSKGLTDSTVLHGLGFANLVGVSAPDLAQRIERCLARGAELEAKTTDLQWTALHTAISEWNVVAAQALLLAGADPNARVGTDNQAFTAGHSCLQMSKGVPEIFALLLEHGADPHARDATGRTVFDDIDGLIATTENLNFLANLSSCSALLDQRRRSN